MKIQKFISTVLAGTLAVSTLGVAVNATDISDATTVSYEQPFDVGTCGSETFRIPAIITLNNGSVMAAADMRYDHGLDSPNNIDMVVAVSENGYTDWEYTVVNHFDDYADGVTGTDSASFIDSAIVQSKETDRIFFVSDMCPSGGGYNQAQKGTGFVEINGKKYLLLTTGNNSDSLSTFKYYVGEFTDGFAPVCNLSDNSTTEYTVDEEYNLYKNGVALTMAQKGSENVTVNQNVFYNDSEMSCYLTTYLAMRYSDDNGETWSSIKLIAADVKSADEKFLGIGPGRGFVTEYNGNERIIFCVYDNNGSFENVSTIYSDDNGETWHRGEETTVKLALGKTSEAQIVSLSDGTLRMYARNAGDYVAYADSTDGGVSWSKFKADLNLTARGNCMVSFINIDKKINGKDVILGSFASNPNDRADGVIMVGLVGSDNNVEWISTYHVNDGFFAYSCLTQLAEGNIGYLYEDQAYHISYMVLTIDDNGTLSEINGNNIEFAGEKSIWNQILDFLKSLLLKFYVMFDLI